MRTALPPRRLGVLYTEVLTPGPDCWLSALTGLGFHRGPTIVTAHRSTTVVQRSTVRLLISTPVPGPDVAPGAHMFADRVCDLALYVPEVAPVTTRAAQVGITLFEPPASVTTRSGDPRDHAVIGGVGTVQHSLYEAGPDLPHAPGPGHPAALDHVCFVLPQPLLGPIVDTYAYALGLTATQLPSFGPCSEVAEAWYLPGPWTPFMFLAPHAGSTGHLATFLDTHGPGVHHIAIRATTRHNTVTLPYSLTPCYSRERPAFQIELLPPASLTRPATGPDLCRPLPLATFHPSDQN